MSDVEAEQEEALNQPVATRPGRGPRGVLGKSFQMCPGTVSLYVWSNPIGPPTPTTDMALMRSAPIVRAQGGPQDWLDDIEQWVSVNPSALFSALTELRGIGGGENGMVSPDRLSPDLMAQHANHKLALVRFQYAPFPTTAQIEATPIAVPAGRSAASFRLWNRPPGTNQNLPPTLDPNEAVGALYREVDSATGAVHDWWCLFANYQPPSLGASVWVAPNPQGFTSLRDFLSGMAAKGPPAKTGWFVATGGMDTTGANHTPAYHWIQMPPTPPTP